MINWIKQKLIKFLGIDNLKQENVLLTQALKEYDKILLTLERQLEVYRKENEDVINTNKILLRQFNLSFDLNPHENRSWAVISIQGKRDFVRFVNLQNKDMLELSEYIKRFEDTNRTVDTPYGFFKDF